MVSMIEHIGIIVEDIDRTIKFYEKLGFKLLGPPRDRPTGSGKVCFLKKGHTMYEVFSPPREGQTVGVDHIAYTVDNIEKVYEELSKEGYQFTRGKDGAPSKINQMPAPMARKLLFLTDPDGLVIQLVENPWLP